MRQGYQDDQRYSRRVYYSIPPKRYGFLNFIADCVMTAVSGGLWLIWVFVREMRRR